MLLFESPEWATIDEPDTYTLIANGLEWTDKQGEDLVMVPSYIVQHDQSGDVIKWCGQSEDSYYEHYLYYEGSDDILENFETFLGWPKRRRKKWKENWLKKLRAEKDVKMSYDLCVEDCEVCYPTSKPQAPAMWFDSPVKKTAKKGYDTMNTAAATIIAQPDTTVADQRRHIHMRARDVRTERYEALRKEFKVNPIPSPTTLEEFVAKIKADDFVMPKEYEDYQFYGASQIAEMIRWTKDEPDTKGYAEAKKKVDDAYETLRDTITILSPEEGLKAFREFESATFH